MLTLYEPKYEDLWFRQMMLADEDTMSYNHAWGGTIPFGEDKWRGWIAGLLTLMASGITGISKTKMVSLLAKLPITMMPKCSRK